MRYWRGFARGGKQSSAKWRRTRWSKGDVPTEAGPTINAFEAAGKNGRVDDLLKELDALFESQNTSPRKDATSIPATFLRVTVAVN